MGTVELNIASLLAPGFGKKQIELTESCTMFKFLEQWSNRYDPGLINRIFDPDTHRLREGILIMINGKAVQHPVAHNFLINPGDVINIMPILIGG